MMKTSVPSQSSSKKTPSDSPFSLFGWLKTSIFKGATDESVRSLSQSLPEGMSQFDYFLYCASGGHLSSMQTQLRELQAEGGDTRAFVNQIDSKTGRTAAHLAAEKGHAEILTWLQENGANLNVQDSRQDTPLNVAEFARASDAVICFLKKS